MDACRASSCCHGARCALWTEVPAVPLARAMRAVPVRVQAAAGAAAGAAVPRPAVCARRWRSWISSPQRRPTRLSIRWTIESLPHSTTNRNIFSTGSPLMGEFPSLRDILTSRRDIRVHPLKRENLKDARLYLQRDRLSTLKDEYMIHMIRFFPPAVLMQIIIYRFCYPIR